MFRFIHTADWQLGKPFGRFNPEVRGALTDARFDAIDEIGRLAKERGIQHVLVAGDVFDSTGPSDRDLIQAVNRMGKADCSWWLLPGNHDHARAGGFWDRVRSKARATIHVVDNAEALEMEDGVWLLPAPLEHRRTREDPTDALNDMATPPGALRIGLAHGSVVDFEKGEAENLIPADRAALSKLDYLALGDWHGYLPIGERTAYSGTPETDSFRRDDLGSVIVVEVEAGLTPVLERVETGRFRWLARSWSVDGQESLDGHWARLGTNTDLTSTLLNLTLEGIVSLPDRVAMLARAADEFDHSLRWFDLTADELAVRPGTDDLAELLDQGTIGNAARKLLEASGGEGADALLAREALERLFVETTRVEAAA